MDTSELIDLLNEDLALRFRAHVQSVSNLAVLESPRFDQARDARTRYLREQIDHSLAIATEIRGLGGEPTTAVPPAHTSTDSVIAIAEELALESMQLARLKKRLAQARALGAASVARAIEPIVDSCDRQVSLLKRLVGRP